MPKSDRPPPARHAAPKPPPPPRPGTAARPGGDRAAGKKDSDSPSVSLDESDLLWDDDDVTPLGGTPAFKPTEEVPTARQQSVPEFETGDDPRPSPFERVTVAPPLPEREYVARMMDKLPDDDRPRRRGAAPTPPPPTVKSPTTIAEESAVPDEPPSGLLRRSTMPGFGLKESGPPSSGRVRSSSAPERGETAAPLVLDLTESVPPGAPSSGPAKADEAAKRKVQGDRAPVLTFGAAGGDALELVGARAQSRPPKPPAVDVRQVRDRFDAGDFSGALIVAEGILAEDPDNADALLYAEHCRDVLKQMYLSRLGGLRRVPNVAVGQEQLRWLSLDHRAGFLLSLVDGRSTLDEVLDMSGMSDLEALRLLVQLLQQNVIRMG